MKTSTTGLFGRLKSGIAAHKTASAIVFIALAGGGYEIYHSAATADAAPQYQMQKVSLGSIVETVTGTGQVSAANQVDITPLVSGAITGIDAAVGDHVSAGGLIATIDSTSALNSLNSAKLALAQLTEAPKATDVSDNQSALAKDYAGAFNSAASTFTDLQTVIPGLNDLLYSQTGFLSDQESFLLNTTGQVYRNEAGREFDKTDAEYSAALAEYKSMNPNSATSSIAGLLADTTTLAKDAATAVQSAQNAITWIMTNQPNYDAKQAPAAQSDAASWAGLINNDVSSMVSAANSIATDQNALTNLLTGADPLQIQADQLAVAQAQQTYDNYFIRSPISGVIGRIPVNAYDQAGASTVIATVIGDQKVADISLDEVDAAKVSVGDPVSITFNAINNFSATGTVAEKDLVGTVSAGVVSYNIKVDIITADPRILPGMSVNVTITTDRKDGVLIIPSTAVKTQGNGSYVQIFTASQIASVFGGMNEKATPSARASGSSTAAGYSFRGQSGPGNASGGSFAGGASFNRTVTVSTAILPTDQAVTTGISDDANTEVTGGLRAGDWVVLKTVPGSSQNFNTAAPSILNSLRPGGGNRAFIRGG